MVGESDGRIKYGRMLKPGQKPEDVVYAEKLREDAIRAQDGVRTVIRWTWARSTSSRPCSSASIAPSDPPRRARTFVPRGSGSDATAAASASGCAARDPTASARSARCASAGGVRVGRWVRVGGPGARARPAGHVGRWTG